MNVTCERCNTEYDFDDTLVSGRGTTVKCTNCGHLFKVRKTGATATAAAPEKWVVRTVDGRELQFNALRELQAAITARTIGREDVLSRGNSRPRRLGAITELEPFFTGTGTVQPPAGTAQALGATAPIAPGRRNLTPAGKHPPLPQLNTDDGVMDSSDMQDDATVVRPNPAAAAAAAIARATAMDTPPQPPAPTPPPARADRTGKVSAVSAGTPPAAPKEVSPPPGRLPGKEGSPAPGRAPERPAARSATPPRGIPAEPMPPARADRTGKVSAVSAGTPPAPPKEAASPARSPEKTAAKTSSTGKEAAPAARPPERVGAKSSAKEPAPATKPAATVKSAESEAKETPTTKPSEGAGTTRKQPVATATPPSSKDPKEEEPRFSTPKPSKRPGGVQRIIAVVAAGVLLFVGYTAFKRYFLKPASQPVAGAPDERITGLLNDADKSLKEGDLQAAQSHLDKASALADKDPRVAVELARLALVQADFKWLRLRLLSADHPDRELVQKDIAIAVERARKAVENAQTLAPTDPSISRLKIDALRLAGNLQEARKLAPSISSGGSQPESALTLAALDLAEEKPSWPSVVERLRTAASGEPGIGRARSMLIYALVRSGDVPAARSEYDQLAGMPRPHPLLQPLRELLTKAEAPAADAGADAADLTQEEAIKLANDLRTKDVRRAEELFQDVLKKNPSNADAAAGLGDIARSRGDNATAMRYYQQAIKFNPVHLPALSGLAELKWEANDRQGAVLLYRIIVENGGNTAFAARAKERLGGPIPEEMYQQPPPPVHTVVSPPVTTPPPPVTTPPPPVTTPPPATTPPPPPPPPINTNAPPIDFDNP